MWVCVSATRMCRVPMSPPVRDLIGGHYYKLDSQIVRATIGAPVEQLRAVCRAILAQPVGEAEDNE